MLIIVFVPFVDNLLIEKMQITFVNKKSGWKRERERRRRKNADADGIGRRMGRHKRSSQSEFAADPDERAAKRRNNRRGIWEQKKTGTDGGRL